MPILASKISVTQQFIDVDAYADSRALQFESLDGSVVLPFDSEEWFVLPGLTGLGLPPLDVATDSTPGLDGGWLREITVLEREVFVPLFVGSMASHVKYLQMLAQLRSMVSFRNSDDLTRDNGSFNIVVRSALGERVLTVAYKSGLEGDESKDVAGAFWAQFGLVLVAVDPYWRDRDLKIQSYSTVSGGAFLGDGSGAYPWPRKLSASSVVGTGMNIEIDSDVPVWPDLQVVAPATSMVYTSDSGASVTYTAPVTTGRTLTIVTDPRRRNARLDNGTLVWGNVAMGSRFNPLQPGSNSVSIALPGASADSQLNVIYRRGWESAW